MGRGPPSDPAELPRLPRHGVEPPVIVVRVVAFAVGLFVVQGVLRSAVRTVVVPRGETVRLSRALFLGMRAVYEALARRRKDPTLRHAVLARFAPTSLVLLAFVWAAGIILGFVPMYWAVTELDVMAAFRLSGSSMTTLGLAAPPECSQHRPRDPRGAARSRRGRPPHRLSADDLRALLPPRGGGAEVRLQAGSPPSPVVVPDPLPRHRVGRPARADVGARGSAGSMSWRRATPRTPPSPCSGRSG